MPRIARRKSATGVYHIVLRGINKQTIFLDDDDRKVFLNRLKLIKNKTPYKLYAFCLISNHIHLLIEEISEGSLSMIISKVLSSFVYWYNEKYKRSGNLFQDRFRSEAVENDNHLLCAIRYIHQNPVKAGMVASAADYRWSSYDAYAYEGSGIVDVELGLSMLQGRESFIEFMKIDEEGSFIENDNRARLSDDELSDIISNIMIDHKVYDILKLEKEARDELITIIKITTKASIRQISRVTGISISMIDRAQ